MANPTKETVTDTAQLAETKTQKAEEEKIIQEGEQSFASSWPAQAWEETSRFFEQLFAHNFPAMDIINRESDILIYAELPGMLKEDLNVTLGDNSVTIKGSTRYEEVQGEYVRREISRRPTFSRTLSLPEEIDTAKGKAKFKDCMLELTLPKKSAKRYTLRIE